MDQHRVQLQHQFQTVEVLEEVLEEVPEDIVVKNINYEHI
jgi:hypothetical protein